MTLNYFPSLWTSSLLFWLNTNYCILQIFNLSPAQRPHWQKPPPRIWGYPAASPPQPPGNRAPGLPCWNLAAGVVRAMQGLNSNNSFFLTMHQSVSRNDTQIIIATYFYKCKYKNNKVTYFYKCKYKKNKVTYIYKCKCKNNNNTKCNKYKNYNYNILC